MKPHNPFKDLTKFEIVLLAVSVLVVTVSFLLSPQKDYLTLAASLIGVLALIFIAKGYVLGSAISIIFSILYGIISFIFRYYGEVITYMGMTMPMAIATLVSWIKHPYKQTKEVEVGTMTPKQVVIMLIITAAVTAMFYFILRALNTANLILSTVSVTTSFLAVYMTYMRSPYYALGYALNDIVLILLWILASIQNISYLPMIFCFVMFLANDIYGFVSWKKRAKQQRDNNEINNEQ